MQGLQDSDVENVFTQEGNDLFLRGEKIMEVNIVNWCSKNNCNSVYKDRYLKTPVSPMIEW
jgi:hypothetical protein